LVMEDTDYKGYIENEANPIEIVVLKRRCKEKLMTEIQHMIGQSTQPLTGFLERMLHCYQIDNVVGMIEGLKNDQPLDILLKGCDPLGYFPELKNIRSVEKDDYAGLYQQVLIDLPIGEYFRKFLDQQISQQYANQDQNMDRDAYQISNLMKEFKAEKIKNMLKKIWLAEFHKYCMANLPGDTSKAVMDDLLKFESDCMTLQIIYNSLDISGLSDARGREVERRKYINSLGYLYPDKDSELNDAYSFDKLKAAVAGYEYEHMLNQVSEGARGAEFNAAGKSIDDVMFIEKAKRYSLAFENGFHYGVFYGYLKLREMEIRNLVWLAELVSIGVPRQMPGWSKYILPFKYHIEEGQNAQ
jgi:V-type H+-transporting ATPase subunit d